MRGVILEAEPAPGGGLRLGVALPGGGVGWSRVDAAFRIYLDPVGAEPRALARSLAEEGFHAEVEYWLEPPWYRSSRPLVVAEHPALGELLRAARRLEAAGAARRVNRYPGPLVEALRRSSARPGWEAEVDGGRVRLLGEAAGGFLRVSRISAAHPCGDPQERPRGFISAPCGSGPVLAGSLEEAVGEALSCRPHLIEAPLPLAGAVRGLVGGRALVYVPEENLVGPRGLLEWMRASWLPYSMAHGAAIGRVLTTLEALEALERRYILEPGGRLEPWRSLEGLLEGDMAGAARIPEPGLYWGAVQLDYSSLYPSLIALYNLSAETVGDPHCSSLERPPGAPHPVCSERRGVVAEALARLVSRREALRRQAGMEEEVEAIKWVLVGGFGYLGYRNSLFGSIRAYEDVTALARRALRLAERLGEEAGYRVIHSIVDSVFLVPESPGALQPEELAYRIARASGVKVKIEARYTWLYIPATKSRGTGAVNKYVGALAGGGLKARGIAMARRSTPPFIASVQREMLDALARAGGPEELDEASWEALSVLESALETLESGSLHPELLAFTVSPGVSTRRSPWRRARPRASPGSTVRYVVTPRGPRPPCEADGYDTGYYARLLMDAALETPLALALRRPEGLITRGDRQSPPGGSPRAWRRATSASLERWIRSSGPTWRG